MARQPRQHETSRPRPISPAEQSLLDTAVRKFLDLVAVERAAGSSGRVGIVIFMRDGMVETTKRPRRLRETT